MSDIPDLTESVLNALWDEAGRDGDGWLCHMCEAALEGREYAIQACAEIIEAAK